MRLSKLTRYLTILALLSIAQLQVSSLAAFPFGDKGKGVLDAFSKGGSSDTGQFANMTLPELLSKVFLYANDAKSIIDGGDYTKFASMGADLGKIGISMLEKSDMVDLTKITKLKSSLSHLKNVGKQMIDIAGTKDVNKGAALLMDYQKTISALKEVYPQSIIDKAMELAKG